MYSGSYSNSNSQSNSYSNGYSSGYGNHESSGDKMANIGAGLKKQTWDLETMPKFEKNFYREAESVMGRSDREVEDFRRKKEIRVNGKHIPDLSKPLRKLAFQVCHLLNLSFFWNSANYFRIRA